MSPSEHISKPTSHPRSRHKQRKANRLPVLLAPALVTLSLLVIVGYAFAGSSNRIATGVEIAGVDVSGLTSAEARQKLEKASSRLTWVPVQFVATNKHFEVAPAQLGIFINWDAAIARARREGDGLGPLRGFKRLEMRLLGNHIKPRVKLSSPALKKLILTIAKRVDKPALEPALILDGSQPTVVPGHKGRALDKKQAAEIVVRTLGSLSRSTVELPVRVIVPSVRRGDLVRVAGQVRTAASAPVLLKLGPVRWTIPAAQIQKMLVFPHDGERNLTIGGPPANIFLGSLAKRLDRPAKDATFSIVGRSIRVIPARIGRVLDREKTASAILIAALNPGHRIASLVIKTAQPKRTTEQVKAMGITGLVGSYETSFSGTANRIHNVQLVAKLIDNEFIAPGAIFSFNQTTGQRSADKGFLTAPQIANGKLVDALGGGICQVSTTVFNAAYEAGLDIRERTNHALYISHYPLGRDATVNWPSPDLKFRNDTDHWILVRTFSSYSTLLVALYGTPQHRKVVSETAPLNVTGPPPVEKILDPNLAVGKKVVDDPGESSYSTHVRRRVYGADGKLLHDDTWYSTYRSSPKVVRVGTKAPKKNTGTSTTTTKTTTTKTTTTKTTTTATTPTDTTPTDTTTTDTTPTDTTTTGTG
jgi:vancomycin resistance protein YoaR